MLEMIKMTSVMKPRGAQASWCPFPPSITAETLECRRLGSHRHGHAARVRAAPRRPLRQLCGQWTGRKARGLNAKPGQSDRNQGGEEKPREPRGEKELLGDMDKREEGV